METFSNRLARSIEESGLGRPEFAAKAGVGTSALAKWLSGKLTPKSDQLYNLAKTAGVTMEWLLTGRGERTIDENIAAAEEWHGRSADEDELQSIRNLLQKRENAFAKGETKGRTLKRDPFDLAVDAMDLRKQLKATEDKIRRLKKAIEKVEIELAESEKKNDGITPPPQ